jgi:hypothetical protein
MKKVLLFPLVSIFLVSCATKTKVEYRDREVTKYENVYLHDTTFIERHDSVFHSVIQRGDTIFDTRYVEKVKWRDRVVEHYNTCWRDSAVIEYQYITKEVNKIPKIYTYALIFSILTLIYGLIKLTKWLKIL